VHEDRLTHEVAGNSAHDLDRVFVAGDLDVPGVRAARPSQLGLPRPRSEDEHLGLDGPFDRPRFDGRRCVAQVGCALARTWSRVTFMLCDSPACFWSAGTI
jgi:hypothetical protein